MQGAIPSILEPVLDALRAAASEPSSSRDDEAAGADAQPAILAGEDGWWAVDSGLRTLAARAEESGRPPPVVIVTGIDEPGAGALAAIEEFVGRTDDVQGVYLPGFGGVAVLYSVARVSEEFAALMRSLELSPAVHEHATALAQCVREQAAAIDAQRATIADLRAAADEAAGLRAEAAELRDRIRDLADRVSVERAKGIDADVRATHAAAALRVSEQARIEVARPAGPALSEPGASDIRELLDVDRLLELLGWPGPESELSLPIAHDIDGVVDQAAANHVIVTAGRDPRALRETICTVIDRAGAKVRLGVAVEQGAPEDVVETAGAIVRMLPGAELLQGVRAGADLVLEAGDELPWGWPRSLPIEDVAVSYLLVGVAQEGSGGSHSIVQEARGIRELGARAGICIPQNALAWAADLYGNDDHLFTPYEDEVALPDAIGSATVAVATEFASAPLLAHACRALPGLRAAYYVQDYEALFTDRGSRHSDRALLSYRAVDGQRLFAKTHWLRNVVAARHNLAVAKVPPSLAPMFTDGTRPEPADPRLRVTAMIRPRTPRRRPTATYEALALIEGALGGGVLTRTFGCPADAARPLAERAGSRAEHLGPLSSAAVAELMLGSDVFIDGSAYQAFGRTGLEAMACGAVPLLPELGGTREYAVDGVNAVLVADGAPAGFAAAAIHAATDRERLARMSVAGRETATRFGVLEAARAQAGLFASIAGGRSE
jgi:hypothetical protein